MLWRSQLPSQHDGQIIKLTANLFLQEPRFKFCRGTKGFCFAVPFGKHYILFVKATRYFREQVLAKRPYLKEKWIEEVLKDPVRKEIQPDNRIRYWGFVAELGKYLRVVTLGDGETVHNAFPDRDFQEVKK